MALTMDEKQQLAQRIARGVQVVCSSIAQLHLGSPDPNMRPEEDETGIVTSLRAHGVNKWKFTNIEGALLLTKDASNVLHFRIYDLQQYRLRFQYELYENLDYSKLSDQFHTFEMENCMCGFSFSSVEVAEKFFKRVQAHKPNGMGSSLPQVPPRNQNRPIQQRPVETRPSPQPSYASKAFNGQQHAPVKRGPPQQSNNMFLGNGMLDPNNVPTEWKKILKKAGLKKKDLKNPKMFQIIKETLEKHNIALDPPDTMDFDDARLKQYYTPKEIEEWKRYQREMDKWKIEKAKYERDLAEYERQQAQQQKLQAALQNSGQQGGGEDRIRASVAKFHGNDIANLRALIPQVQNAKQAPTMNVAHPAVPALPPIPEEERIAKIVNSRASRVVLKTNLLAGLNNVQLKRASVLPEIKNKSAGEQNSILETLKQRLVEQRKALKAEDDDEDNDSGSEWEED